MAQAASKSQDVAGFLTSAPLGRIVAHRLAAGFSDRLSLQNALPWPRGVLVHPFVRTADVINLHNIHGHVLPLPLIPALARRHPVVWTLHDMWPLTGHCAYNFDCPRWETGCGACPDLRSAIPLRRDTTAYHWALKRRTYRRVALTFVAPSRWLADVARRSPLLEGCAVRHIPYGLETHVFRPMDRGEARRLLGLPAGRRLALLAADSVAEPRKGAAKAVEALRRLPEALRGQTDLVSVGQNSAQLSPAPGMARHDLGVVADDRLLAAVYAACDLYVCPTLADNLPNTILESMACGTPVAAFETGGVADLVRPVETGLLAPAGDSAALAQAVRRLLEDDALRARMARRCRETVLAEYALEVQARRYAALYAELLEARQPGETAAPLPGVTRRAA